MQSLTNQEIRLSFQREDLVIPKGTKITHMTATGFDPKYNFVDDFSWYRKELKEGFARKMAIHDMVHYGINVPAEFVESVREESDGKSLQASKVLQMMDDDFSYEEALNIVLNKSGEFSKFQLESELNIYV